MILSRRLQPKNILDYYARVYNLMFQKLILDFFILHVIYMTELMELK